MTYILWSAAASGAVIALEFLFRRGLVWHEWWLLMVPAAVGANYLIYRLVTSAPTYIMAFPVFALFNLAARAGLSHFFLGEPIHRGNMAAVAFLGAAIIAGHLWK